MYGYLQTKFELLSLRFWLLCQSYPCRPFFEFLDYLKMHMDLSNIRHSNFTGKKLKKICVLGGSGSFAIEEALIKEVDCYVTADLKYHDFFKSNNKILLVDIGHYESEKYTKELILNYLNEKIPKFACVSAKTRTNPVNYY